MSSGEMMTFGKRKGKGTGYLAHSERVGPGVLLLHEFFGLTDSFRQMADDLNEAGFTVLAPDLYDGAIATSVDEAKALARSVDAEVAGARLQAASDFLVDNWHPRLGVLGLSMGGEFGFEIAGKREIEALVVYYSGDWVEVPASRPPLLIHLAETDEWVETDKVLENLESWGKDGVETEHHVYPGTGHWFANAGVPDAYDEAAASLAWSRTVDFFTHHLA